MIQSARHAEVVFLLFFDYIFQLLFEGVVIFNMKALKY